MTDDLFGPLSNDIGTTIADNAKQAEYPPPSIPGLTPTVVYDTYWRFAVKRQQIFFARLDGKKFPWSPDPIMRDHKFTNAYRASDRASQYLIRNVIYAGDDSPAEVFFRTLLFKFFNRIDTWDLLSTKLGPLVLKDYRFERYDKVFTDALARGERIYSAAYIMPSGGRGTEFARKHQFHLRLLEKMISDRLPERLAETNSMKEGFELLRGYRSIGDFLAYQYVTDLNYAPIPNWSEMEFVCPGPGAKDGIRKCFRSTGFYSEADVIRLVTERQDEEFSRLGLTFPTLWGRKLQLIDCQNLFCEVDKYARIAHPEITGFSGRSRIKQRFLPGKESVRPWYPPKWGLNERIGEGSRI